MKHLLTLLCLFSLLSSEPASAQVQTPVSDFWISPGYAQGCAFYGSRRPYIQYINITDSSRLDHEFDSHMGINRRLRVGTFVNNLGPYDGVFGPVDSAHGFVFHPAHDHWHYMGPNGEGFIVMKVSACGSNVVAASTKLGYQLVDAVHMFPSQCELSQLAPYGGYPESLHNTVPNPIYNSTYAGMSPGHGDPYSAATAGNHVNIGGIPNDVYTFSMKMNIPPWINQGFDTYPDSFMFSIFINDPYSLDNPPPLIPNVTFDVPNSVLMGAEIPQGSAPASVTGASADGRVVSFTGSGSACSYFIQRQVWEQGGWMNNSENGGAIEVPSSDVSGGTWTDVNALAKRTYRWGIIAKNAYGTAPIVYTNKTRVNR